LAAVAEVLDDVLGDVPPAKQHQVRVAAHLARLVERESELGAAAAVEECRAIAALLGEPVDSVADGVERLAAALRERDLTDADFDVATWHALVATTRRDLEVAKPGHAGWTGS
jgi:hypothetical protein